MRLAVVSDVDANLAATEAIFREIDDLSVKVHTIICAGDIVGRGAHPNEVIQLLRSREVRSVRGNYDEVVSGRRQTAGMDYPDSSYETLDRLAIEWTRRELTKENAEYLAALPREIRISTGVAGKPVVREMRGDEQVREQRRNFMVNWLVGGLAQSGTRTPRAKTAKQVVVVHASPRDTVEYLHPETSRSTLSAIAADSSADVLLYGHPGRSFQQVVGGTAFISVGSAGRPRETGKAEYAVIDISGSHIDIDFGVALYDADREARDIERSGLPSELADVMRGTAAGQGGSPP